MHQTSWSGWNYRRKCITKMSFQTFALRHSPWRRAIAENVNFVIFLWWQFHLINSFYKRIFVFHIHSWAQHHSFSGDRSFVCDKDTSGLLFIWAVMICYVFFKIIFILGIYGVCRQRQRRLPLIWWIQRYCRKKQVIFSVVERTQLNIKSIPVM